MPLDATHLRFALDVKDNFPIHNLSAYLSGTIYPDSRFIYKLPRLATHADIFLSPDFYSGDDFKIGWAVHLICDRLFDEIVGQDFPDLIRQDRVIDFIRGGRFNLTVLKFVADRLDSNAFPFLDFFPPAPEKAYNNEDLESLREYYSLVKKAYDKNSDYLSDRERLWEELGIAPEIVSKIKIKYLELNNDPDMIKKIKLIYPKMLAAFWAENKKHKI